MWYCPKRSPIYCSTMYNVNISSIMYHSVLITAYLPNITSNVMFSVINESISAFCLLFNALYLFLIFQTFTSGWWMRINRWGGMILVPLNTCYAENHIPYCSAFGLIICYFIYMKRDWAEHRCLDEDLSHLEHTRKSEHVPLLEYRSIWAFTVVYIVNIGVPAFLFISQGTVFGQ